MRNDESFRDKLLKKISQLQYATSESVLIPMNNFETPDENGMTSDINF